MPCEQRPHKTCGRGVLGGKIGGGGTDAEEKLNREAAGAHGPAVWKHPVETVTSMCNEWNSVSKDPTLTCNETVMGDWRVRCAARAPHQTVIYNEPKRHLVRVENSAREAYGPRVVLSIEEHATALAAAPI